jgi:hypothetical protein
MLMDGAEALKKLGKVTASRLVDVHLGEFAAIQSLVDGIELQEERVAYVSLDHMCVLPFLCTHHEGRELLRTLEENICDIGHSRGLIFGLQIVLVFLCFSSL